MTSSHYKYRQWCRRRLDEEWVYLWADGIYILRTTSRIDSDRHAFQAEATAARRAFQLGMDQFRNERQRLADQPVTPRGCRRRLTACRRAVPE